MSRIYDALRRLENDPTARVLVGEVEFAEAQHKTARATATTTTPEPPIFFELQAIQTVNALPGLRLVALADPTGMGNEKFRLLALRLAEIQRQRKLKKLLITSSAPGEGKSFVAANVAVALAMQPGQRVLMIEGDVRKPVLASMFGQAALRSGLTEFVERDGSVISDCLYHFDNLPLWLLPAGTIPENPLDTLQSSKIPALLEHLTESFTWVIVDSCPVLPLADANVWARLCDGILVIVRQGKSLKTQLEQSAALLDRAKVIGAVFNDTNRGNHGEYAYYKYGYGGNNKKHKTS